jgi:GNAT superfamily N-acetyltransferase
LRGRQTPFGVMLSAVLRNLGFAETAAAKLAAAPRLDIRDFTEVRYVFDDTWNRCDRGDITRVYYEKSAEAMEWRDVDRRNPLGKYVGCINYRVGSGQVGIFLLEAEYRGRGLGPQILLRAIGDMRKAGCDTVWAVTSENHPFWSTAWNKAFAPASPAGPGVSGSGYAMPLPPLVYTPFDPVKK